MGSRFSPRYMSLDEKVKYGMMALSGAALIFSVMGVHISPLETIGGYGN